MRRIPRAGFTLVELIVVIVVIGILAGIVAVGYPTWRKNTTETAMKNDLLAFASAMENGRNFNNGYPSSIPADFKASNGNIIQLVGATSTYYCADAYNASSSNSIISYDSDSKDFRNYPCSGVVVGSVGGTMPSAPRGVNLSGDYANWYFTGASSVSNGVLTPSTSGYARSPMIRVNAPRTIVVGGDFFANQQTAYASSQPNAMVHVQINYYGADGTTAVTNNTGHTANGCARSFPTGSWRNAFSACSFTGGPNIQYVRFYYLSSANGYSSPDLQIRNPLLTVSD